MSRLVAFASGLVFAAGLAVSGMTNPAKVRAFLDVAGPWDASLGFVMLGAVAVFFAADRLALRRARPLFAAHFPRRPLKRIDIRLLGGAALFGVGWGLSGFCPGPAIVSVGAGARAALWFVPALVAGVAVTRALLAAERDG